jgi:hypothetical protein
MTIRPGLYLNAKPVKLSGILIEGIITLSECKTCKMVWYLQEGSGLYLNTKNRRVTALNRHKTVINY